MSGILAFQALLCRYKPILILLDTTKVPRWKRRIPIKCNSKLNLFNRVTEDDLGLYQLHRSMYFLICSEYLYLGVMLTIGDAGLKTVHYLMLQNAGSGGYWFSWANKSNETIKYLGKAGWCDGVKLLHSSAVPMQTNVRRMTQLTQESDHHSHLVFLKRKASIKTKSVVECGHLLQPLKRCHQVLLTTLYGCVRVKHLLTGKD